MKQKITKYGLMMNGELLKYSVTSNSDNCEGVSESYSLATYGDKDWLVNDEITAEYVRNYNTPWYNANYEIPINPYVDKKDKISVVKVETTIEPISVKIPTAEEYLRQNYANEPNHLEYCLKHLQNGTLSNISLYEMKCFIAKMKGK